MMSKKQFILLFILSILFVGGSLFINSRNNIFQITGLDIFILVLIIVLAIIFLIKELRKQQNEKSGLAIKDELSSLIKYKSGYYAFLYSMYMWLFIFLLKDKFPDIESMLGGGILLSALIFYISHFIIKRNFYEKSN